MEAYLYTPIWLQYCNKIFCLYLYFVKFAIFDMFEVQKQTKFKSLDNSLGALRVKFDLDCIRWGCEIVQLNVTR